MVPVAWTARSGYYNLGFSHQFSPRLDLRLLYPRLMNVSSVQPLDLPGFRYEANIVAAQVQARV